MLRFVSCLILLAPLLAACGTARIWSQDAHGGVIALQGDEDKAMEEANAIMASHCGRGRYQIVRRDTAIVGQEQYTSSNTDYGERTDEVTDGETVYTPHGEASAEDSTRYKQGNVQTDTVAGTRDVYEPRITYRCLP